MDHARNRRDEYSSKRIYIYKYYIFCFFDWVYNGDMGKILLLLFDLVFFIISIPRLGGGDEWRLQ